MKISHTHLIELIVSLRYISSKNDRNGVCHGYVSMGMQAFFANDLTTFSNRIDSMNAVIEKSSGKLLRYFSNKNSKKLFSGITTKDFKRYKKEFLASLKLNNGLNDKDFYKLLFQQDTDDAAVRRLILRISANHLATSVRQIEEKRIANPRHYRKNSLFEFNKLSNPMDDKDKSLITVRAFVETLVAYHLPHYFNELFKENAQPNQQEAELAFSITLPHSLTKKVLISKKNLKTKKKTWVETIELPLITKQTSFAGFYNIDELTTLFNLLTPPADSPLNIAFKFTCSDHTIAVCKNAIDHLWYAIDANNLPLAIVTFDDAEKLAEHVMTAFTLDDYAGLTAHLYSKTSHIPELKSWFSKVESLPEWIAIHDPQGKQHQVDSDNASLLYYAVLANKVDLITQLLNCNPPPDININILSANATPFTTASAKGYIEIVQLLLDNTTTDVNLPGVSGYSALQMATESGHLDVVKLLLNDKNHILDIQHVNASGDSAFKIAIDLKRIDIMEEFLKSKKYKFNLNEIVTGDITLREYIENTGNTEMIRLVKYYNLPVTKRTLNLVNKQERTTQSDDKVENSSKRTKLFHGTNRNDSHFSKQQVKFHFHNKKNNHENNSEEKTTKFLKKKRSH